MYVVCNKEIEIEKIKLSNIENMSWLIIFVFSWILNVSV